MLNKIRDKFKPPQPKEQVICGECGYAIRQTYTEEWVFSRGQANGYEVINTLAQMVGCHQSACQYLDNDKIECLCSCH